LQAGTATPVALLATRLEDMTRRVAERSDGRLEIVLRESLVRHPEIFEWDTQTRPHEEARH